MVESGTTSQRADAGGRYAEYYRTSRYGVFPQEHRSLAGGDRSSMILVEQGPHELSDPAVDELIVVVPLKAAACPYSWNMGAGWAGERSQTGDLIVVPPHVESRWKVGGSRRLLIVAIPVETVRRLLGPECPDDLAGAFEPIAGTSTPDLFVNQLMQKLWQTGQGHEPVGRLLSESALTALVCQLLARSLSTADTRSVAVLSPREMRRLVEHVDKNLHEEIGLVELAEIACVSVRHFTRIFRHSTGETPHRWLMARRVERAKHFLNGKTMSLAQVALNCGFADQSHFTTSFRRLTGCTPQRWRKHLL